MNIPQDTLQQVADAAFLSSNGGMMGLLTCNKEKNHVFWHEERYERRAVIQHALENPAIAPFLAGGIGEYTDEEIKAAAMDTFSTHGIVINSSWFRAFLAALPRRESPAIADLKSDLDGWKDRAVSLEGQVNEAIARAEKAEAERDRLAERVAVLQERNVDLEDQRNAAMELANKAQAELAALKSAQLGILRPIAEMPETVPDGCMAVFRWRNDFGSWVTGICKPTNGFFAILRLPDAEDTPPADPAADATTIAKCAINNTEQNVQFRATAGYGTWGAAEPEPAAQVPLGPEDVPPGSVFTFGAAAVWITPLCVSSDGVGFPETEPDKPLIQKFSFGLLQEAAEINTSLPDTGRWDANAWRTCSKPGKEVAK